MKKRILGFTLIELLIVITIIGILAVVFLPSILGAPEKARDAARHADLANIVQATEAARLDGKVEFNKAPVAADGIVQIGPVGCASDALIEVKPYFGGGTIPADPDDQGVGACAEDYLVTYDVDLTEFSYGVVAMVEKFENANVDCALGGWDNPPAGAPDPATSTTWCYGVRIK